MYFGPYNAGRFKQMGVSANRPTMDKFRIFSTISSTKSKSKEGIFYVKH